MRFIKLLFILSVLVLAESCTTPVTTTPSQKAMTLADFPEQVYLSAKQNDEPVYSVDKNASEVEILVFRGGTLARLGHDHIITSRDVHGYVLLSDTSQELKADLYVPLATLSVDEAEKRDKAGLVSHVSEKDIAGTKSNMLEKVLETDQFPYVFIHVEAESMNRFQVVKVSLNMHGTTRDYLVPVQLTREDDRLSATGQMVVRQTDFAMTPYSVLGGALKVKDEIILSVKLQASRLK